MLTVNDSSRPKSVKKLHADAAYFHRSTARRERCTVRQRWGEQTGRTRSAPSRYTGGHSRGNRRGAIKTNVFGYPIFHLVLTRFAL